MRKAIVFYCDILGFSELVSLNENDPNEKIFQDIKTSIETGISILKSLISSPAITTNKELSDKFRYKLFSDNLYVSMSYNYNDEKDFITSFWVILFIARSYQEAMLLKGILIRGGISFGNDYCDDNIIFSPGLIKAYKLENQQAVFSRVIIDTEIVNKLKFGLPPIAEYISRSFNKTIICDWAELYFINPVDTLHYVQRIRNLQGDAFIEIEKLNEGSKNIHLNFIKKELEKVDRNKDRKIFEKLKWFYDLITWIYFDRQTEKEHYDIFQNFQYLNIVKDNGS